MAFPIRMRRSEHPKSVGGGAASTASVHAPRGPPSHGPARAVWAGRLIFILALCVCAAVLGYTAHYFLQGSETELAESQFESIADRALFTAHEITLRKRLGAISMASIAGNVNPDPDKWPFVTILGYEEIATTIIETSDGREMGFCPFVTPEQLGDFEDFAYDLFETSRKPGPFPNGTATSSFGKGVWGFNPKLNTTDNRYRETDGNTSYGSPNKLFTPILQHNAGPHKALMVNVRFEKTRGTAIDSIIDCARQRNLTGETLECGAMTDMLILTSQAVEPGPGALLIQPIFAANDKNKLVGIIASSIVFDEVLVNVVADKVDGVDCVLETGTQVYTYRLHHGKASLTGAGDLHDPRFDQYKKSVVLTGDGLFSTASATYMLTLYPSQDWFQIYSTTNPMIATVGAVCIMVFTSLLFFLYDFYVRQEFNAKKQLLEAKRKFVRFVSHEVRTPLNTVCMGLTLMQEEISGALGYNSSTGPRHPSTITPSTTTTAVNNSADVANQDKLINRENAIEWFNLAHDILSNAQSAVGVLNDLLNYDKIEMGALALELSVVPIWSMIERTCKEFKFPAGNKNIEFNITLLLLQAAADGQNGDTERPVDENSEPLDSKRLPLELQELNVVGDKIRITQALRNLISNALKFTPEGGSLTVEAAYLGPNDDATASDRTRKFALQSGEELKVKQSGYLRVSVTDTGAGMTEEQLSKLFQAGVQFNVNELQAGQGSGLGLYITKGIVEQHEGEVRATSPGLGLGTTFAMTMPLYHVLDQKSNTMDDSCQGSSYHTGSERNAVGDILPMSILVVDDACMNRKLLCRLLANHGHTCTEAQDGQEAVDIVKNAKDRGKRFDTILMDYEMPVMNGPVATKAIRALGCDSFIIGITGNVLPEDIEYFKRCGANGVLPKPFALEELEQLWVEFGVSERNESVLPNDDDKQEHNVEI